MKISKPKTNCHSERDTINRVIGHIGRIGMFALLGQIGLAAALIWTKTELGTTAAILVSGLVNVTAVAIGALGAMLTRTSTGHNEPNAPDSTVTDTPSGPAVRTTDATADEEEDPPPPPPEIPTTPTPAAPL